MALAVLLASALIAQPADAKSDQDKLQGEWKLISGEAGGMAIPPEAAAKIHVTFQGAEVFVRDKKDPAAFSLDPAQRPAAITLRPVPKAGAPQEADIQGIYQIEGEKLKLCLSQPGQPRPSEFKSPKGSEAVLLVLEKNKGM
jgi:uncharacterized protein (TIGR03067 family)